MAKSRPKIASLRKSPLVYSGLSTTTPRTDTGSHIALIEIDWLSGTEYYSFEGVRTPNLFYDDLTVSVSPIRRSVSVFGGQTSFGDFTVGLYNRSRKFSIKLATETPLMKNMRVKLVDISQGYSTAITLAEGQISSWKLSNMVLSVTAKTTAFQTIASTKLGSISPTVSQTLFPNTLASQANVLVPLLYGRILYPDMGTVELGSCPAYLIDTSGSPHNFVYIVAVGVIGTDAGISGSTTSAFQYGVACAGAGLPTFSTKTYNSTVFSTLEFDLEQRDASRLNEMEITAFLNGSPESGGSTPILDPVRALEVFLAYCGLTNVDTALQTAAKAVSASQGYSDEYLSANYPNALGAIISNAAATIQDIIETFSESFGMQLYMTRDGKLATFVDTDAPLTGDVQLTDENDIIKDSFSIGSSDNIATSIIYNFQYRATPGYRGDLNPGAQYLEQGEYSVPGELELLGGDLPAITHTLNLEYCRSSAHAYKVARSVGEYFRSGCNILDFDIPIRYFGAIDLNKYVSVTHWQGISASGGYTNAAARITDIEITVQPTAAKIHLSCISKVPYTSFVDKFTRSDASSIGTSYTISESASNMLQVESNKVKMVATDGTEGRVVAFCIPQSAFGDQQIARMRLIAHSGGSDSDTQPVMGIFVQGHGTYDAFRGYAAVRVGNGAGSTTLQLKRYDSEDISSVSSGGTLLASVPAGAVIGTKMGNDILELRFIEETINGSAFRLEVWVISQNPARNGLMISYRDNFDNNFLSGTPGIIFANESLTTAATIYWDEFEARDF